MAVKRRTGVWVVAAIVVAASLVWLGSGPRGGLFSRGSPLGEAVDTVEDAFESVTRRLQRGGDDALAPFEDVEWKEDGRPRVMVGGDWYELDAVDGWAVGEILEFAEKEYGKERVEKRFEEDLVEMMARGWKRPGLSVKLRVRLVETGEAREIDAAMTRENRQRLWAARFKAETGIDPLAARTAAVAGPGGGVGGVGLSAPGRVAALRELVEVMGTRHSYTVALGAEERLKQIAEEEIAGASGNGAGGMSVDQFRAAVHRVIGSSIDGHARAELEDGTEKGPFFPFLLVPLGDEPGTGVVAVKPDRSGLVDPERPYVAALGGVGIEEMIGQAGERVAKGSPALRRERACRWLRFAGTSAPTGGKVAVEFAASADAAAEKRRVEIVVGGDRPRFGAWPRREGGWLKEGEIGYIRLAEMDGGTFTIRGLEEALEKFGAARGLVIDVRGNGGGARDALLLLASRLMPAGSAPLVYNAARPLRLPGESDAQMDARMASRFLRRADDATLTGAERAAVERFAASFRAKDEQVRLADSRFGPWYYGVVSAEKAWARPGRRVVVLMDNVCFSATDVFLMAMKEIEGVTLVGRPSAGGSGLVVGHAIGNGAVKVVLSSMVSFQPDGALLDGVGVTPDVVVWPRATDFVEGGTDLALEKARELLGAER